MMITHEGNEIDYFTKEAGRYEKKKLKFLRYTCNSCSKAILGRAKVKTHNEITNEVASSTVLELSSRKAFLAIATHVEGCPFSNVPIAHAVPTFGEAEGELSANQMALLAQLTVSSVYISFQCISIYL
jgi:hypothetical protein